MRKKLSTYIWEYKWHYLFAIASLLVSVSLDMLAPMLTMHIIDDVILGGNLSILPYLLGGILIVGVGRCIFQYTKEYTFDKVGSSIASDMRKNLFDHIQSLSSSFFDKTNTGELMARVKDDIDRVWNTLSYVSMLIIEVIFHTCVVLFCMYRLHAPLAIIPTIAMFISAFIAVSMERHLGSIYEDISEENAVLNTVAEENLAGVRTVKAFAREKFEINKFLSHNQRYYELNMRQSKVFVRYYPYLQIITKLLPMIILLLGGRLVIQGTITLGVLGAFLEYSNNIVWPMEMLGWLSNDFSAGIASNKKLVKIYTQKPAIIEAEHPAILDKVQGKIEFSHVSFHKEDMHEILHDITFEAAPGSTVGIMGATGAGKTSVIQLLQRLYDATDGYIRLDGVDIRELSLKQLRSSISIVMQDVFLFSDTINENVKLGKKEYIDEAIVRKASRDAQASSFIEKMPDEYETVIGERGVGLSGGQKQRISIARALAKHTPILIMDDSTSALDMETEHEIQKTLNALPDTTKLIIAHRISAVRHADEIIVLENGSIAERGTHDELLAKKGLYYTTYVSQYGEPDGSGITSAFEEGGAYHGN
ncbi:MAG: ABC transporter ATP-binding protein/permease [Lachnospiraceae bacterium]|nr:ABC transporter ATP-binding protein/permease [Lachnospiraceae bacterium]